MNGSRAWFQKDFYKVLGVAEKATTEEIKRAYKNLARKFHPDRNPGDKASEERMKEISEAYDVLADEKTRAEYDQVRHLAHSGYAGGAPGSGWENTIRYQDIPFDMGDIFGEFFGGRARARRGADLETALRVSFEDAVHGSTVAVRTETGEVKVRIPAGIADGARIRVRGRGRTAEGGAGDLYVIVRVNPHSVFARRGDDLVVEVTVSFPEAALGAKVTVPTLNGAPVTVKIPAGTQPGKTFRVRGKGVPRTGGGHGDLLATIRLAVPDELTREQRELIEQLARITQAPERPKA
ncbi:MAG: J domain-containing protein [Actinomycetota bacterium]